MPTIDLSDDELAAVIAALEEAINRDRYHLAPRLEPFRRTLAKLDPKSVPKPGRPNTPLPHRRHPTRLI
jgi:hypothetical protein